MNFSRTLRNCALTSLAASTLLLAAPAAMADVIRHYTLSGATMESGGTMTGSFDWDATTERLLGFDFMLPMNAYGPATTFDSNNARYVGAAYEGMGYASRDASFNVLLNDYTGYLNLIFDGSLAQGGVIALATKPTGSYAAAGSYFSHNDFTADFVAGGVATTERAAAVPEPATLGLFAIGLLPFAARRRRAAQASV